MTTFALFVYMICALAAALRWPLLAALTYLWLTVSHPQTGNIGIFAWQWSLITILVFVVSYFARPHKDFSIKSSVFGYVFLFYLWTTFTTFVALAPPVAWGLWWDFTRIVIAFFAIGGAISSRRDLNLAVWAILAGVASVVASGIMQVVLSGGASHVMGVAGSDFAGNNEVARLFGVACLPYALFFSFHAQKPLLRKLCRGLLFACVIAIIGTYSRGAFVALVATFLFIALISRRRWMLIIQASVVVVILSVVLSATSTNAFLSRMQTIQDYQEDGSFQGREFAWNFAWETAAQRPVTGGGFGVFRLDRNSANTSGTEGWKDAHSIYFESLGEHGYVGLALYMLMILGTFFKAYTVARRCKGVPGLYWERDLAIAAQISLVFHLVGGLTISATYAQYMFFTLLIVAALDKITREAQVKTAQENALARRSKGSVGVIGQSAFRADTK